MRRADDLVVNHSEVDRRSGGARVLVAVLGALSVLYLAYLVGLPVGRADGLFERWLGLALEVGAALACVCRVIFVREERRIWALVALAVSLWALGDVYWRIALWNLEVSPVPSLADVGWLAFYVPAYAAIALLVRARVESVRATLWVDGVIGGLAVASIACRGRLRCRAGDRGRRARGRGDRPRLPDLRHGADGAGAGRAAHVARAA